MLPMMAVKHLTSLICSEDLTGSLLIMACVTIANMRRNVVLHKLILLEVLKAAVFVGLSVTDKPAVDFGYLRRDVHTDE